MPRCVSAREAPCSVLYGPDAGLAVADHPNRSGPWIAGIGRRIAEALSC